MKNEDYHKYLYWGLTALAVTAAVVVLAMAILNAEKLLNTAFSFLKILYPVIYGFVMAYLMDPVYTWFKELIRRRMDGIFQDKKELGQFAAFSATMFTVILLCAVVGGFIMLLVPQLYQSLTSLVGNLNSGMASLQNWILNVFSGNKTIEDFLSQNMGYIDSYVNERLSGVIMPNITSLIGSLSTGVRGMLSFMKNFLIGIFVMAYMLNMKQVFKIQLKMILYGVLPLQTANGLIRETRFVHSVFGGFISGKLLDSLIVGIISFAFLSLLRMPYVLLVSFVIGCTNIIPFFGPFIGAIPSAVLILIAQPDKCIPFIVFIFALQMFDGYVLGPKILGGSTGLPSFWILFSILLFGGLFGFVGMIVAVPTFAVIYKLSRELICHMLVKRGLSLRRADYAGLDYIDEKNRGYVRRQTEAKAHPDEKAKTGQAAEESKTVEK